ncbi:MAG: guanine deaminase [Acidobacteriia bacterium]|nr:guanine deaminase [Terriglobia bacterium]
MSGPDQGELLRAPLFHTPRNPFLQDHALESYWDGGLLIRDGRIAASGDFETIRAANPSATITDLRGGFLLPGLIDTHIHFPQLRIIGGLGRTLLDWLEECALPEEARMADESHARRIAQGFVHALASHGTTTALVFGAHFAAATAELFEAGAKAGLRIVSGMVLSDRKLRPELHQTPEAAYRDSSDLVRCFHGRGRLLYAVTPRFALSTSEAMLEVCQTLRREHEGLRFQTHLNENSQEIAEAAKLFPWAPDYLAVYERFGVGGRGAVMAHNVHPTASEIERLAAAGTAVAHCPCSNAALGSGLFDLKRHIEAGVRVALGTDIGGGIGFGLLKEALQAYLLQRIAPNGALLDAAHMLYLATRAGAEALGLETDIGDFQPGKAADLVYIKPPADGPLSAVLERTETPDQALAAIFTLAGAESVSQVRVEGSIVYKCASTNP